MFRVPYPKGKHGTADFQPRGFSRYTYLSIMNFEKTNYYSFHIVISPNCGKSYITYSIVSKDTISSNYISFNKK